MPQWFGFAIFFPVVTLIYGGAHYYIYSWFVRLADPPKKARRIFLYLFIFMVASFPVGKILGWRNFNAFTYGLNLIASVWMGHAFYFFLFALASDLLIIFARITGLGRKRWVRNPLFYKRALVVAVAGGVFIIGGYAFQEAAARVTCPDSLQPTPELDGFRSSRFRYSLWHADLKPGA
jgi:hypothetical protein